MCIRDRYNATKFVAVVAAPSIYTFLTNIGNVVPFCTFGIVIATFSGALAISTFTFPVVPTYKPHAPFSASYMPSLFPVDPLYGNCMSPA